MTEYSSSTQQEIKNASLQEYTYRKWMKEIEVYEKLTRNNC